MWASRCLRIQQTDNGLNGAKYELRLPRNVSGLIQVSQNGKPVLTWRSAAALDRIPIWSAGSYEVRAENTAVGTVQATQRG